MRRNVQIFSLVKTAIAQKQSASGHAELVSRGTAAPVAPMVLAILDGWGYRPESDHNAVREADTPVMDALWAAYPHTLI